MEFSILVWYNFDPTVIPELMVLVSASAMPVETAGIVESLRNISVGVIVVVLVDFHQVVVKL